MEDLARKLINLGERQENTRVDTVMFGSASTLTQSLETRQRVRIGLWPCLNQESPRLAMGLFTVLGFLLERWQDIRVYRLFAQLEGDPADYQWTIQQSQFSMDDWDMEPLDENVAIEGNLDRSDGQWKLTLEIENDLGEGEQEPLVYRTDNVAGLVNLLPKVATDIAQLVEAGESLGDSYSDTTTSDEALTVLFSDLFHWQLHLFLSLWGVPWNEDSIESNLDKLIQAGATIVGDLGVWCVANAVAQALLPGYGSIAQFVAPAGEKIVAKFPDSPLPAQTISEALLTLGQTQQAYDMLEAEVEAHPNHVALWKLLAELYRRGGAIFKTIETYQRAIETDTVDASLYQNYAQLMSLLSDYNGEFALIETDDGFDDTASTWEAIEAYEEALELTDEPVPILLAQLLLLADFSEDEDDEERLWEQFEKLVTLDQDGEAIRAVVDALEGFEEIDPAIDVLEKHFAAKPTRADLLVDLAVLQITNGNEEQAIELLEKAETLTEDDDLLADIDRLLLSAEDPDFEMRLGEIIGIVNAGTRLKPDDVSFLEHTIERAPSLVEAYGLLAKAYQKQGVAEEAMQVLMDGLEETPDNPELIGLLAEMLWESGEKVLALEYLNKGIAAHPNHVPLLVLAGQYLFEDNQHDAAKLFLARAETISPRHPALGQARAMIARHIAENKGD